jgi:hypothetical protein
MDRIGEWLVQCGDLYDCFCIGRGCQKIWPTKSPFCLPDTCRSGIVDFSFYRKQIPSFCSNDRIWHCLGEHDGNTLFVGSERNSQRKIWGLYGDNQYDDCGTDDFADPEFWIYVSKFFLNNDPGIAIVFAGILLLLAAAAVLRIEEKHDVETEGVPMGGGH